MMKVIDLIRALIYLFLGIAFTSKILVITELKPLYLLIFGILLIVYGAFRIYQVYNKYFLKHHDKNI
jgi:hypothetical protein